jgi:hypothetical protein
MWLRLPTIFQGADERFPWLAQTEASLRVHTVGTELSLNFLAGLLLCSPTAFTLVSRSIYPTLKMKTSVDFQRNTKRYIPEDNHSCDNLKSYILQRFVGSEFHAHPRRQPLLWQPEILHFTTFRGQWISCAIFVVSRSWGEYVDITGFRNLCSTTNIIFVIKYKRRILYILWHVCWKPETWR